MRSPPFTIGFALTDSNYSTQESSRMAEPSGKIVARPMVARACGHEQEFQHYSIDKYRAQRLMKFKSTRCADCVAKLVDEQRQAVAVLPKKGEAVRMLPIGTALSMTLNPKGIWVGKLIAEGKTVEITGVDGGGPQSVLTALARQWAMEAGAGKETAEV